jgi:hypothetical protein
MDTDIFTFSTADACGPDDLAACLEELRRGPRVVSSEFQFDAAILLATGGRRGIVHDAPQTIH